MLLFIDGRQANSRDALSRLADIDWPPGAAPEVVDVMHSRALAQWYGILRFPAVAVVEDGMLVAIEHEYTPLACRRLLATADARGLLV